MLGGPGSACGLILPTEELPTVLGWISWLLPLTYAVNAMQHVVVDTQLDTRFWVDAGVITGMAVALLALGAVTLRRQTR